MSDLKINDLLTYALDSGSSDLHLSVGSSPMVRINGEMKKLQLPILDIKKMEEIKNTILNDNQKKIFSEPDFEMGDAIIFRQDLIPHGVDTIDENEPLDWSLDKGRYLFIPLCIRSEYIKAEDNSTTMVIPHQ